MSLLYVHYSLLVTHYLFTFWIPRSWPENDSVRCTMRINLIPMAGAGVRFAEVGYTLPKPLIPVSGKPMILQVIHDLPEADQWIFVVRREHVEQFAIDQLIKKTLPEARIIVDEQPIGQATTCLLAREYIQPDDQLLIAGCDNGYVFDKKKYEALLADPTVDAVVWTFTERETLRRKPEAWGWHVLESDGRTIERVQVKIPVSNDPFHDHAVVATFTFKRAADFFAAADAMIARGDKTKNEYYVDSIPNYLREMGKRSVIFDVDLYVGWGKPDDLHEYEYIEYAVKYGGVKLNEEQERLLQWWRWYFNQR